MWSTKLQIFHNIVKLADDYICMKRLGSILSLALIALAVSCLKPESERVPETLQITAATQTASTFNGEIRVKVVCDLHWKAELKDSSWASIKVLSINEKKGGEFVITLKDNLGEEDRNNTVTVKAGKGTVSQDFVQSGLLSFFKPRSIELEGTREGSVVFTSPYSWTAVLPENPDWVKLTSDHGDAGYSRMACRASDENVGVGSRETVARLTIGDHTIDVPVVQGQKDVILSEDSEVEIGYEAQELSVRTQFNVDYSVDVSAGWIKCIQTKAPLNEGVAIFSVEENSSEDSRSAEITFKGGSAAPLKLKVEQEGKDRVLNHTAQGAYGIEGVDYILGEEGWNQRSLLLSPDGSYRLRLFNPADLTVVELVGIRFDCPLGEEQQMQLRLRRKEFVPVLAELPFKLLRQEGELYWFSEKSSGVGFIVKK
jgi:hypothetical protein